MNLGRRLTLGGCGRCDDDHGADGGEGGWPPMVRGQMMDHLEQQGGVTFHFTPLSIGSAALFWTSLVIIMIIVVSPRYSSATFKLMTST